MANMTLLSDYAIGDTNFDAVMTTLDATRRVSFSISEFDTTSAAVIEAGSIIDVGGALYEAQTDVTISTTDPYTSSTVADGPVYIVLQAAGTPSTVSAAWTATAPVWRADYQGWYKTATVDRYIGGCVLSGTTTVFISKYVYDSKTKIYGSCLYTGSDSAERSFAYVATSGNWLLNNDLSVTFYAAAGEVYKGFVELDVKNNGAIGGASAHISMIDNNSIATVSTNGYTNGSYNYGGFGKAGYVLAGDNSQFTASIFEFPININSTGQVDIRMLGLCISSGNTIVVKNRVLTIKRVL